MIKVLHFISSLSINSGLMSVIMNYYRVINRSEIQFGFLYFKNVEEDTYEEEIKKLGGKIYYFNLNKYHLKKSFKKALDLLDDKYDILHVHELYLLFVLEKEAKKHDIKYIIGHAHTIKYSENFISGIRNKIVCTGLNKRCDVEMACSREAGKVFFKEEIHSNKFVVLNNAIELEKFRYNDNYRSDVRKQLGLPENVIVIGHVGRFTHPKNHPFIIDVFYQLLNKNIDYRLILVGDGKNEDSIKRKVKDYHIEDKVLFLGSRKDVYKIYSAMDLFIFPSLYEGLGFALIEAQTNGLTCYASDAVPKSAKVLDSYEIIELDKNAKCWANMISEKEYDRDKNSIEKVTLAGYNIVVEGKKLEDIYKEMLCGDVIDERSNR